MVALKRLLINDVLWEVAIELSKLVISLNSNKYKIRLE